MQNEERFSHCAVVAWHTLDQLVVVKYSHTTQTQISGLPCQSVLEQTSPLHRHQWPCDCRGWEEIGCVQHTVQSRGGRSEGETGWSTSLAC